MLKRINKIQNIGRFKSCIANSVQFEKITLIFGRNTYGKSTLSDLFSSLATGNTDVIKSRKTIPIENQSQQIELSFSVDNQQRELPVKYHNDTWQPSLPNGLKFFVFDDSFYHTNLFAGRQFTRETKDNFSSFVLGVQGVAKQQIIEEKNKVKNEATRDRNNLKKTVFKDIDDLVEFIRLSPSESKEELTQKIDLLREDYSNLSKQQKNALKILERKECRVLFWENDFPSALQKLNSALQESLEWHYKDTQLKLNEHIRLNFKDSQNAENWIRQGISQNKGENCQFCGQALNTEALNLLDIYRQSFDKTYEEYDTRVKKQLAESQLLLIKERINSLRLIIEVNNTALNSYSELEENYCSIQEKINQIAQQLNETFDDFEKNQNEFKQIINSLVNQKKESPYKAIEAIQFEDILNANQKILSFVEQYNSRVNDINVIVQEFKNSIKDDSLNKKIKEIERLDKLEARKLQRLNLADECSKYNELELLISQLNEEIPQLEEELSIEQSDFLSQYFERLNDYFKLFGSDAFQLEKGLDTRYSLKTQVLFCKNYQNLCRYFRRKTIETASVKCFLRFQHTMDGV